MYRIGGIKEARDIKKGGCCARPGEFGSDFFFSGLYRGVLCGAGDKKLHGAAGNEGSRCRWGDDPRCC